MASTSQPAMATAGSGHGDEQVQRQATWPEEADGGSQPLVMPEDGYQWKKYGQKFIKNIQKIRSYFRCRDRRCGAKKKVEWQPGDPSLRVVYDGAHQHGSPSSSSSHGGGGGQDGDGNRYELSAQYFGGGAPTPQAR
ncbi:probable WRKY transcription factor 2 [Hordeum vulgare subsp. vulgare]|uniref:WRKY domain-containing protein n=2 Tax=Hordeum vulgare TaxID=4513 RepID=A0A8I6XL70_HORVV|nr:probable WRKY transcription factor 2 [Hordeum vulgare subsp. vulgare]AFV67804.1 WRKY transcript factor 48 [Hordeum vulgare]KAI4966648.1 hypothetical protein ZWY2020_037705 [Hordeum vulgare]KAI4998754.1 hypothetical protein ZWY2020_054096 [Hordeum vulgare]